MNKINKWNRIVNCKKISDSVSKIKLINANFILTLIFKLSKSVLIFWNKLSSKENAICAYINYPFSGIAENLHCSIDFIIFVVYRCVNKIKLYVLRPHRKIMYDEIISNMGSRREHNKFFSIGYIFLICFQVKMDIATAGCQVIQSKSLNSQPCPHKAVCLTNTPKSIMI